jgi:hypothetical protein
MPIDDPRFTATIARIDAANAEDPHGKEILYSQRMTAWLGRIEPSAGEALRLAARAQHIRRWTIPRADYPMDRIGYLKWRTTLYKFHADEISRIMTDTGYDESTIARVASLVKKERIRTDAEAQTLEDVICLVFLENYFADFAAGHDEQKVIDILRKTWKKMSPRGQSEALKLPIPPDARRLVEKALM